MRILISILGSVLLGATGWMTVGFAAAMIRGSMPGGQREGMGAMTGFFFIGPIGGIVGLIAGAVIVWRLTAEPARLGPVSMGLAGLVVVMIVGLTIAMTPRRVQTPEVPGQIQVEAKLEAPKDVRFELRASGEFDEVPANIARVRTEGSETIVPGAFRLGSKSGFRILAVMSGERQVDVQSIDLPAPGIATDWTPWLKMDSGTRIRWRVVVEKK